MSEAMLVERVEELDGQLVASGRKVNGADRSAVMDAWKELCAARRNWALAYRAELGSAHEDDASDASKGHRAMVGPAQKKYEGLVGEPTTRPIPVDCRAGLGEILDYT